MSVSKKYSGAGEVGQGEEDTLMFLRNFAPKILQNIFGRYIFIYARLLASLRSDALRNTSNQKEFFKRQQKREIP